MAKEQFGTEVDATHMNNNANTLTIEAVETPTLTPTQSNKKEEEEAFAEDTLRQQTQEQPKDDMLLPLQTNGEIKQPKQIRLPRATSTPPSPPSSQVLIIPGQQAATLATNAARKIRRAFSMPRNPFRWSRKFKTTPTTSATNSGTAGDAHGSGSRGANSAITSCVSGGRGRSGSIVSLNSYEMLVCKDSNGNVQSPTEDVHNKRNTIATSVSTSATNMCSNEKKAAGGGHNHARVLRRSSFRKFLHRIAQHLSSSVNTVGPNNKHTTTNGTRAADATAATTATSERVPPIGGHQWPADQTPGVMGLKNHGNTCFMNAVLQCLSHTDILAEYFVLDQYKADLKRRNKINARKFGTKGELTEQLANVLKALWTCKNESDHSTGFKAVVDRYGAQFRSSTQHDAQEFLFWLLDKVHEDLNTATKRRYKSVKNNYGRPDEIIAAETLANHIRCNNSFVQAVFQAQFRSSLTCPRCQKQSNTFDPFHCISVQLPQLTQQTIFVTVVNMKQKPRQVKIGLTVPAGSPIVALREQLQTDTGIAAECMVLVDLNQEGFTRVFYDTQPVETLKDIETIYCIEVPAAADTPTAGGDSSANEPTVSVNVNKINSKNVAAIEATKSNNGDGNAKSVTAPAATHATDLLLLVANVHKKKKIVPVTDTQTEKDIKSDDETNEEYICERFGAPFSMKAPRDCSYMELQKKMLREMSTLLRPEVFSYATPLTDMFQIRLQDPSADPDTYLENVEHPLLTEMIDMALSVLSTDAGPPHVKLLLEWTAPEEHFVDMTSVNELVVEHESVARLSAKKSNDTASLTLEQCLEHYTKAETLSAEDAWRCPHCQQYLPVVKTLGLWSLPDILVVHFKRFRQHHEKGPQAAKLTTMVKFPLNSFDMSPHLARGINGEINAPSLAVAAAASANYRPSPWKKTRNGDSRSSTLNSRAENKDTRYDLYAVCYHQGDTLETGHYTAACKNPYDRQWYKFDDQRVSKVPEDAIQEEIINNEAYMLFYQRRVVDTTECSGSSSNSGDHWVSRIAPASAAIATKEKSQEKIEVQKSSTQIDDVAVPEKERVQSKPIEIPKVCSEIDEDTSLTTTADELVNQPTVTMSTADKRELLNIEELDYADADVNVEHNDVVDVARQKEDDVIKHFDVNKDCSAHSNPDAKTIFKMDEEVKLTELTTQQKLSSDDSTDAEPEIISTIAEVLSKPPVCMTTTPTNDNALTSNGDGKISPYDIKSQSASNTSSANSTSSSLSSGLSPHTLAVSVNGKSSPQSKLNGLALTSAGKYNDSHRDIQLSSSLKSHTGSMNGTPIEFQLSRHHLHNHHNHHHSNQQNWHGSRSSVSAVENGTQQTQRQATSLKLRHSFSTSSNYKLRECSETLSSLLRNSANTCSKDTLLFIDQQSHHHGSLIEDDSDSYMGRSLWISPVTPHKLITVSPKN